MGTVVKQMEVFKIPASVDIGSVQTVGPRHDLANLITLLKSQYFGLGMINQPYGDIWFCVSSVSSKPNKC
jgi:hypothetical protein